MEEEILKVLQKKEMDVDELSKKLHCSSSKEFIELNKKVNALIDEGRCFEHEGKIYLASLCHQGSVRYEQGILFVGDYRNVLNADAFDLMNGDEIIYKEEKNQAVCIKIVQRKNIYVLGKIIKNRRGLYFYSDDYKYQDYRVKNLKEFNVKENDRVLTIITDYKKQELKIQNVLGQDGLEETLIHTILLMNNAPGPFSKDTQKQIEEISSNVDVNSRIDLRDKQFITIDGDDAKDYDDAICVEKNEEGYVLYVSIADVSFYVTENSPLDKDAIKRGCSIYYPGHVIPMLPEILCNDLCSLKEGVDRYTITCKMNVGFDGNVESYDIFESVICSVHRMTYSKVNKIISHDEKLMNEYSDIKQMLFDAYELSRIVDHNRKSKGGIEFNSNEPIIIEENGKVVDIQLRQSDKAEILIEDFMILANETVATHMFYLTYPLIYRNHDYPKSEKISMFVKTMTDLGYSFKGNIFELKSSALQKCLTSFKEKEEYSVVSDLLLRSMAKAIYESTSNGHYGLGLDHYCHFTSPIRRYPDLVVHRMLRKYLFQGNNGEIDVDNSSNNVLAKQANETEKRAVQIERNILDLKRVEYMKEKLYQIFEGRISSVMSYGFYVELPNTVEGLVHVKTLDGYFELEEDVLTNGEVSYKIGQKVKVRLIDVDLNRRTIDFEIFEKKNKKARYCSDPRKLDQL